MTLLGLDIGSSSVKAGILRNGRLLGHAARAEFRTRYEGVCAEVEPQAVLRAIRHAIGQLRRAAKVDLVAMSVMAPSWLAVDASGKPLTPVVTHQDRRSIEESAELIAAIGRPRLLSITGNLPFPGGISSTTCAWFFRHERARMRRAALVGHLNTYLLLLLTGSRVTDPGNASFMGIYRTTTLGGWDEQLCSAVGVSPHLLPEVRESNEIAGHVTRHAARNFGIRDGTPVLVGCMDTDAAMLLAGARPGQLLNVSGSTDVLAVCTGRPKPHERLLTRAFGVGRRWLSVGTIAAAGSALDWARRELFGDLSEAAFQKLLRELAREPQNPSSAVRFEPYLAGERTSLDQRSGAFTGLTLATTRRQMLAAMIESLARASAGRLPLLRETGVALRRDVLVSGGVQQSLADILHRDWGRGWRFRAEAEATLRGLARLASEERN